MTSECEGINAKFTYRFSFLSTKRNERNKIFSTGNAFRLDAVHVNIDIEKTKNVRRER